MTPLFSGTNIRLRALEPSDLQKLFIWENDPGLMQVTDGHQPVGIHTLAGFIDESHKNIYELGALRLIIQEKSTGEAIGSLELNEFTPFHLRASIGIHIESGSRQKGYATEAVALITKYVREELHLRQLIAQVRTDNKASLRLFRNGGFVPIATLPDWIREGNCFHDLLLLRLALQT